MVISKNSQLGLSLWDAPMMREYLEDSQKFLKNRIAVLDREINNLKDKAKQIDENYELPPLKRNDGDNLWNEICKRLAYNPGLKGSEFYTIKNPNPRLYLIQNSVYECAKMIRINENFSCSIFNKIKDGEHVYLMGKHEFFRFVKFNGAIRGCFWNRERHIAFEVGFHLELDKYYFPEEEHTEFNRLVRLMTFIELGDIEIEIIEKGRNNGKPKKQGKVTNTSEYNVYVVDSSWNKIIIRTEGFAVMGHFRLQACGAALQDRKLIWINAFEKHGYKRSPKAKIIHD